jgi:GT2 family glycosyltransferase
MEMALSFEKEVGLPSEIVVVDDGSAVPAKITGLKSRVRLLRNDKPGGFCAASNQALMEVKTRFALLLDADITFLTGDFAGAYEAFVSLPRLAWSNFQQVSKDGRGAGSAEEMLTPAPIYALGTAITQRWWEWKMKSYEPEMLNERVRRVLIAHSSSALVRMEAFRDIGGFDLRFWQCQSDNDVCLRLEHAGWIAGVDEEYTVQHDGIGGKTGGKRRVYDLYRGRLMIYEIHQPITKLYLRLLLFLRHLAEALVSIVTRKSDEHLTASFRLHLALNALLGYPR